MKKRTKIIILILLSAIFTGLGSWYYMSFISPQKFIAEKCQGLKPNWNNFIDCYGVVLIHDG